MRSLSIWTDGGARGNPGPAAIGVVIREGEQTLASYGRTIGETTNNRAEYAALFAALESAKQLDGTHLTCYLDSQLVVEQLNGNYRIKDPGMREAATGVQGLAKHFEDIRYVAIPREKNAEADRLVNEALDLQG